jgi:hypothetical protein
MPERCNGIDWQHVRSISATREYSLHYRSIIRICSRLGLDMYIIIFARQLRNKKRIACVYGVIMHAGMLEYYKQIF